MVAVLTLVTAGNALAGVLYTVRGNDNRLFSIDTDSFALTDIGPLGVNFSFGGLAYDPNMDVLYMVDGRGARSLYTVNRNTGAATLVGNHGVTDMFGLAFDSLNNVLYGGNFGPSSDLWSFNVNNGAANNIGNTGLGILGGLAYDSTRDRLVAMQDGAGDLYEVDRSNGSTNLLFNGPFVNDSGLAYDGDKDLYWNLDFDGMLRSYDPNNTFNLVLEANFGRLAWDGLAYLSSPNRAPEPATLLLFGTGLVGRVSYARRKNK